MHATCSVVHARRAKGRWSRISSSGFSHRRRRRRRNRELRHRGRLRERPMGSPADRRPHRPAAFPSASTRRHQGRSPLRVPQDPQVSRLPRGAPSDLPRRRSRLPAQPNRRSHDGCQSPPRHRPRQHRTRQVRRFRRPRVRTAARHSRRHCRIAWPGRRRRPASLRRQVAARGVRHHVVRRPSRAVHRRRLRHRARPGSSR
jgi:hypothetical protein